MEKKIGNRVKDITNRRFGRLIVKKFVKVNNRNQAVWLCKCDCGNETEVVSSSLMNGHTKSCRCFSIDTAKHVDLLPVGEANFNRLFGTYIKSARKRNIAFELTKEEFKELVEQNCKYCGRKPTGVINYKNSNGKFIYNGVDRVNNDRGYILDNCVPCCKICNRSKDTMTEKDFMLWIKEIYLNNFGQHNESN